MTRLYHFYWCYWTPWFFQFFQEAAVILQIFYRDFLTAVVIVLYCIVFIGVVPRVQHHIFMIVGRQHSYSGLALTVSPTYRLLSIHYPLFMTDYVIFVWIVRGVKASHCCDCRQTMMKDLVTPVPVEEINAVVKSCLEKAALINYTKMSEVAKIEGQLRSVVLTFCCSCPQGHYP